MAKLIKMPEEPPEGEFFNRWLDNRFRTNKNALVVTTGPTGSGKSYQDLRRLELWYKYKFNEEVPPENICFSIAELITRLRSKNIRKGEIFILEEAGVNAGSLDYHNDIVKTFNYVLQSFRSMNVGIFFNLPYLSMLVKQARMLIHVHFETHHIDQDTKKAYCKGCVHQVNQKTGKIYTKSFQVAYKNGWVMPIEYLCYSLPSKKLIEIYEEKKKNFLDGFTEEFELKIRKLNEKKIKKEAQKELTDPQLKVFNLTKAGYTQKEIGKMMGVTQVMVSYYVKAIRNKGYEV